jgi:hypothetical protein
MFNDLMMNLTGNRQKKLVSHRVDELSNGCMYVHTTEMNIAYHYNLQKHMAFFDQTQKHMVDPDLPWGMMSRWLEMATDISI